jgi:serine kinase of HPr protein (carbohydrate metabolism regulator)
VADDRVELGAVHGRLVVRPAAELAGLLEVRGLGIQRLAYEPMAVVRFVCDLADPRAQRLPDQPDAIAIVEGITLPRLSLPVGVDPLPIVAATLETLAA